MVRSSPGFPGAADRNHEIQPLAIARDRVLVGINGDLNGLLLMAARLLHCIDTGVLRASIGRRPCPEIAVNCAQTAQPSQHSNTFRPSFRDHI